MLSRNSFRVPRHPAPVGLARRRVRDHLADWGHAPDDRGPADAMQLGSETATHVVRHGSLHEREFAVAVTALAYGSRPIEVSDEGRVEPRLRVIDEVGGGRPGPASGGEHRRGLGSVEQGPTRQERVGPRPHPPA